MDAEMTGSAGFLSRDADRDREQRQAAEQDEAARLVAEAARQQSELAEVEQAVEDNAEDPNAWQRRGEVYLARGRTQDALNDYKQAVALDADQESWMIKMWDLEKQVADEATERSQAQAKRDQVAAAATAKEAAREQEKRNLAMDREEWKAEHKEQMRTAQATTRVLQAEAMKDKANAQFKKGQFDHAMKGYSKGLTKLGVFGPESTESALLIRTACLLNRAACALKLQQPESSAEDCSAVLDLDPANVKALYRRGLAFAAMEMADAAVADLTVAAQLKPEDGAIKKQLAKWEAQAVPEQ